MCDRLIIVYVNDLTIAHHHLPCNSSPDVHSALLCAFAWQVASRHQKQDDGEHKAFIDFVQRNPVQEVIATTSEKVLRVCSNLQNVSTHC
jgi:hypothetical protein